MSPSDRMAPLTLSVTSARLLVTSRHPHPLIQFDADGDELRQVQLPNDMVPRHAVESPTETFIVSLYNKQLKQDQVVEVNNVGEVLRKFGGSRLSSLGGIPHIAVDCVGNVFVADCHYGRILLLQNRLSSCRVIVNQHQLRYNQPRRICYSEQSGHLLVRMVNGVAAFYVV